MRRALRNGPYLVGIFASLVIVSGCALLSGHSSGILQPHPGADWQPILSPGQISAIRQLFPLYQPALLAPGTPLDSNALWPGNFAPEMFFGPPNPQGFQLTPAGIRLETNGYDQAVPPTLPSDGTYYDLNGNPYPFTLAKIVRSPLNILQTYMGVPQTPNAPTIAIDPIKTRVDPTYVDNLMFALRSQYAMALPGIANVNPQNVEIVIEPAIFYVGGSGGGGSWAGGLTEPLGHGRYRIHLQLFQITKAEVNNWSDFLIDEGLNFYVLSVGRPDLAH
jgi:hypothetical protein